MPNFQATNEFRCPNCDALVNGASGFSDNDKPVHDSFTICVECNELSVYVIQEGIISLRPLNDEDRLYIKNNPSFASEIEAMHEFIKSRPK